jgi:hypothetical protein
MYRSWLLKRSRRSAFIITGRHWRKKIWLWTRPSDKVMLINLRFCQTEIVLNNFRHAAVTCCLGIQEHGHENRDKERSYYLQDIPLFIKAILAKTIQHHYLGILNFFNNGATNAAAESFNAKIKAFRNTMRGVRDVEFFLFRLSKFMLDLTNPPRI